MEVVVDGELAKTAAGDAFHGVVRERGRIKEYAKLLEVKNLARVVNGAAVLQIASVLVAQQHLSEINGRLDRIATEVKGISDFLDTERRSAIRSAWRWLRQAATAALAGEFSPAVRQQLEDCERLLLQAQEHLLAELYVQVARTPEHKDVVGTEQLAKSSQEKYERLSATLEDIKVCIDARIAAWLVLSLFPGEDVLKQARRADIGESIDAFKASAEKILSAAIADRNRVQAFWNKVGTLEERRNAVLLAGAVRVVEVVDLSSACLEEISRADDTLRGLGQTVHVLLAVEDGAIVEVRMPTAE